MLKTPGRILAMLALATLASCGGGDEAAREGGQVERRLGKPAHPATDREILIERSGGTRCGVRVGDVVVVRLTADCPLLDPAVIPLAFGLPAEAPVGLAAGCRRRRKESREPAWRLTLC